MTQMSKIILLRYMSAILSLVCLMTLAGCAGSSKNIESLETQLSETDSQLSRLESQLRRADARISELAALLRNTNLKIDSLKTKINANDKELYLKVISPTLNIRKGPKTGDNIIAVAKEGAYFRRISCSDKKCQWLVVEFLVDGYPYLGYVSNSSKYLKEEFYDPMTFNTVYKRGLIKYQWEKEVISDIKTKGLRIIGISVKADALRPDRFRSHLARILRSSEIYSKPIENFSVSAISQLCRDNSIDGILAVEIESSNEIAPRLDILLYDRDSLILYSTSISLQAIEVPEDVEQ